MLDLKEQRETLLANAADCELIANLATDPRKRATFKRLTASLKNSAEDLEQEIAAREALHDGAASIRITKAGAVSFCSASDTVNNGGDIILTSIGTLDGDASSSLADCTIL